MVGKSIEANRGHTPPLLDLETLKSDLVVADVDGRTAEMWPTTTWRGFALWTLAALAAIMLGVIPALWINRWRAEATARPAAAPASEEERAPVAAPTVEPIEAAAQPQPKAEVPAATVAADRAPVTTAPVAKTIKRTRAKGGRVKQPPRPPKNPTPTCDIYLHPHGCPR